MLYSVIDIGSNTVKIAVLEEEELFHQMPVFFKAVPLNLRSKVIENRLPDEPVRELSLLIQEFAQISRRLTPNPPIAFATASLRGLENAAEILAEVERKSGVTVRILSGEEEALYSFLGAKGGFSAKAGITVDLGGGSMEILSFCKNKVIDSVSLPFGCLTLYHRFFEEGKNDFDGCCRFVREHLKKSAPKCPGNSILLSGGSAKAVLKYKNILENKKNVSLGNMQMKRVKKHFDRGEPKQKEKIAAILKDRFRLIPPAIAVFSQITAHYRKDQVFVCRYGVREGALYQTLQKK